MNVGELKIWLEDYHDAAELELIDPYSGVVILHPDTKDEIGSIPL